MREIPNQPSKELGAQLVICSTETEFVNDVPRLARLELLFVDGWGEVMGEWSSDFDLSLELSAGSDTPRFATLAHFVLGLLQNRVFVAHHVEDPLRALHRELELCSLEMPQIAFIDTMDLARQLLPGLGSYTLDALCARFHAAGHSRVMRVWQLLCHLQALDPQDRTPELRLVAAPTPAIVVDPTLQGLCVCVSGFLPHVDESALSERLRAHGATVHDSPTAHTDVVLLALGYNPALAAYALSLHLPLLGIEWFDLLCQNPAEALTYAQRALPRSVSATEPSAVRPVRPSDDLHSAPADRRQP